MTDTELRSAILVAHETGDRRRLEALQAEFRSRAVERVAGPGSITLRERGSATVTGSTVLARSSAAAAGGAVVVSADAAWQIRNLELGAVETGGFVYGRVGAAGIFHVEAVRQAVEQDSAAGNGVRLDWDLGLELGEPLRGLSWVPLGCWHTHIAEDAGRASEVDLRGAAGIADRFGEPWLEIVLHARERNRYSDEVDYPAWGRGIRWEAWLCRPGRAPVEVPVVIEED